MHLSATRHLSVYQIAIFTANVLELIHLILSHILVHLSATRLLSVYQIVIFAANIFILMHLI